MLRYDRRDRYRADAADIITQNYRPGDNYGNYLIRNWDSPGQANPNGRFRQVIAAADPSMRFDDLSLRYLSRYWTKLDPEKVSGNALDEADNYAEDAQRLHRDPRWRDTAYGRIKNYRTGERVLQYWFFYYYNGTSAPHEGDWEMVQVQLGPDQRPTSATYAQHEKGERCRWPRVEKVEGRPVVYVANESHASYFSDGSHGETRPWGTSDEAFGNLTGKPLKLVGMTGRWVAWPGLWGRTGSHELKDEPSSPRSPARQGTKWSDPIAWSRNSAIDCTEPSPATTTSTPKPTSVTRSCKVVQPEFGGKLSATARGASCQTAKRVLKAWDAECQLSDVTVARCRADGYNCVTSGKLRRAGRPGGRTRTTCRNGAQVVAWRFTPSAASAPADSGVRDCPDVATGAPITLFDLSVRNLSCEDARRLAGASAASKFPSEGSPTEIEGFTCTDISVASGSTYSVVRCVKGSQAFRFSASGE